MSSLWEPTHSLQSQDTLYPETSKMMMPSGTESVTKSKHPMLKGLLFGQSKPQTVHHASSERTFALSCSVAIKPYSDKSQPQVYTPVKPERDVNTMEEFIHRSIKEVPTIVTSPCMFQDQQIFTSVTIEQDTEFRLPASLCYQDMATKMLPLECMQTLKNLKQEPKCPDSESAEGKEVFMTRPAAVANFVAQSLNSLSSETINNKPEGCNSFSEALLNWHQVNKKNIANCSTGIETKYSAKLDFVPDNQSLMVKNVSYRHPIPVPTAIFCNTKSPENFSKLKELLARSSTSNCSHSFHEDHAKHNSSLQPSCVFDDNKNGERLTCDDTKTYDYIHSNKQFNEQLEDSCEKHTPKTNEPWNVQNQSIDSVEHKPALATFKSTVQKIIEIELAKKTPCASSTPSLIDRIVEDELTTRLKSARKCGWVSLSELKENDKILEVKSETLLQQGNNALSNIALSVVETNSVASMSKIAQGIDMVSMETDSEEPCMASPANSVNEIHGPVDEDEINTEFCKMEQELPSDVGKYNFSSPDKNRNLLNQELNTDEKACSFTMETLNISPMMANSQPESRNILQNHLKQSTKQYTTSLKPLIIDQVIENQLDTYNSYLDTNDETSRDSSSSLRLSLFKHDLSKQLNLSDIDRRAEEANGQKIVASMSGSVNKTGAQTIHKTCDLSVTGTNKRGHIDDRATDTRYFDGESISTNNNISFKKGKKSCVNLQKIREHKYSRQKKPVKIKSKNVSEVRVQTNSKSNASAKKTVELNRKRGSKKNFQCKECGKVFSHMGTLKVHLRSHDPSNSEYKCPVCGKFCSAKSYLTLHLRTHGEENLDKERTKTYRFKCETCGQRFQYEKNLDIHVRFHLGEKPYRCDICGMGFIRQTQVEIHRFIHTGEKPFQCEECGMTFRLNSGLMLHMNVHTDDKPYKCDICGMSFGRISHLNKHIRLHTGERPFNCLICDKSFRDKDSAKVHMKTHSELKADLFSCFICSKNFKEQSNYKKHLKSHTSPQLHSCIQCKKTFSEENDLIKHERNHSKEKPEYWCQFCEQCFMQPASLFNHLLKH